jgi:hypothetical protein
VQHGGKMPNATFLFEGIDKASVPIIFTSCLLWSLCLVMVSLGIAASWVLMEMSHHTFTLKKKKKKKKK